MASMSANLFPNTSFFTYDYLPLAATYCRTLDVIGVVDRLVPTSMGLSAGLAVQAMVLDVLSGRSPLYRVEQFWEHQDRQLLLGSNVPAHLFNDTNLGRSLDAIFEAGSSKIVTELGLAAARVFNLDVRAVSYDTTSTNVWGEYRGSDQNPPAEGPRITYGHSKDGHPDQKQFMTELLCVERGVPIFGSTLDGNSSDKSSNNVILSRISSLMARHGLGAGAFVYVADSAMVTLEILSNLGETRFVSRLPENFKVCSQTVGSAVESGEWVHIGKLAELESTRIAATYKAHETAVELEGTTYRAVVIHSDAHDRRKQKSIDNELAKSLKKITSLAEDMQGRYFCEKDAQSAVQTMSRMETSLHTLKASFREIVVNKRGRPPKQGPRATETKYDLIWEVLTRDDRLQDLRERAGCFILLTNVPSLGEEALDARALLRTYKGQYGIESDFGFLKDPLVVNDLFLKTPSRIDALGMILIIALLVWRLMERQMRLYLANEGTKLPGWDNKPTDRPTTFMVSTVFGGIMVARMKGGESALLSPLSQRQILFLTALGLDERVFLDKSVVCIPDSRGRPND
ncbi:MAG: IS1634 family transposase [Sphaerochaeta associata]|uniref:IS1634 family transposase n=1 Tax=Sphaerochaeta associata TaxID=1129264 RepID=UPI002B1FA51C|nr:IS1634 family transposase [Sphaerochaeta associata]MEA5030318.1 IS1634 family transposase [Sphaerochaeta associata]MEA5107071.1 IS1634 family transposase [Sphaerochaeta associata]